ncbi:ATP-binding protein [bacterium]|nr:ATP-binding protein [bacterium]
MMNEREKYKNCWDELSKDNKMVFISGPRQSGKTTLAKEIIAKDYPNLCYYNYDYVENKAKLIKEPSFFQDINRRDNSIPLVIFDEIHKYTEWKNYLKGVYDQFHDSYKFLVSGSGRLDVYQKGGDSLAGRYFLLHLWPFTLGELAGNDSHPEPFLNNLLRVPDFSGVARYKEIWDTLSSFSGFPEPFLKKDPLFYQRWINSYYKQLIYEDIRDLSQVRQAENMGTLFSLLPSKVGSPLSINQLALDIKVSPQTVTSWIQLFEKFFLCFSLSPWTKKISRSIVKERKLYLINFTLIKNEGIRLENMVALELYRAVTMWTDLGYGNFSLHFIRNKEKEEVDFLIARDNKPIFLVEVKTKEESVSRPLKKFQAILNIPAIQLVDKPAIAKIVDNILVTSLVTWVAHLP